MTQQLHELLVLKRPVLFFDCETTGPKPAEDRVVSLAFIQIKPDGTEREWESLIDPCVPIPYDATYGRNGSDDDDDYKGHGITDAMVQGCKTCHEAGNQGVSREKHDELFVLDHEFRPFPTFREIAPKLLPGFSNTDFGGYNVKRYDLPLMAAEFARNGFVWDYSTGFVVDAHRIWQLCSKRRLTDAVELFLGRKHKGAHSALTDVRESRDVTVAQLKVFTSLPRQPEQLHEKCWPKDPNAVDPDGKIMWKDGEAVMNFGKNWIGKPLRLMARKDLDWIAGPKCQGASPAVKQICRDAMAGKFPLPLLKETV